MKTRLLLLLSIMVIALLPTTAAQDVRASILEQAQSTYLAGDWVGASAAFEQLIGLGVSDPAIYINLGHAYAQQGKMGEALLNYRRAEALAPRDSAVLGYIASIIVERQGQSIPVDTPLQQLYRLTADLVTDSELAAVVLILWTVSFAAWAIWLFDWLTVRLRSSLRLVVLALTALLIPLLMLLAVRLYMEVGRPAAVLVVEQAVARSGPAAVYMDLYTLYAAAEMRILHQEGGWALVELPDGRLGWLPVETFRLVRTPA
jgi:tetratricopeptide (TPR) repeat protein